MGNLAILKDIFGEQVSELSEDQINVVKGKLDKLLETRVDTKVKIQTEVIEADAKEKYDAQLKEATDKFNATLKTLENEVAKKASSYKEKLEEAHKSVSKKIKEEKESAIEEFKTTLVEKVDKYLKYELDRSIPETFVEAAAKVQILEPIVEGFKKTMNDNYIKFDEENLGLIKDAKEEIVKLRGELAESVKSNMGMNEELLEYKRSMKISQVCEGLTDAQRERASMLLESYDVEEIEERFSNIRDIIIEGEEKEEDEKADKKCNKDDDDEKKVDEESSDSGAPADRGGKLEKTDEAESEEDTMNAPTDDDKELKGSQVESVALKDDQRLIESWAKEFKRVSR